MEYKDRLRELGLTDLETRRKRGDLLQIHKIKKGFEWVDLDIRENKGVSEGISRRHNSQITRGKQGGTMRDKFLINLTATTWNFLPSEIVETDTVNQSKAKIDRNIKSETWRRSVYRI